MSRRSLALLIAALSVVAALVVVIVLSRGTHPPGPPASAEMASAVTPALPVTVPPSDLLGLSRVDQPRERDAAVAAFARRWLETDRRGFLDLLDELEVEHEEALAALLPGLRAALTQLDARALASPLISELVARIAAAMAESDPAAAVAWVESTQTGDRRDHALAAAIGDLTAADPARAQELFSTMRQPARRIEAARAIATTLAGHQPRSALAWANTVTDRMERNLALTDVLNTIAADDPDLAAEGLIAFEGTLRTDSDGRIARYRDEFAAAQAKPTGGGETERQTPEAFATAQNMENERMLAGPATAIARTLAAQDPSTAIAWVKSLGSPELRQRVMAGAVAGWADSAPEAAWFFARSSSDVPSDAAREVFTSWAEKDSGRARAEIAVLTDPKWRDAAITGAAQGWLARADADAREVAQWTDGLPAGRGRDAAIVQVTDVIAAAAPEEAWRRALTIGDAAARRDALTTAFAGFLERNPTLARAALADAGLQAADQRALSRMYAGATSTTTR